MSISIRSWAFQFGHGHSDSVGRIAMPVTESRFSRISNTQNGTGVQSTPSSLAIQKVKREMVY
jgi:hypothetical protein